MRGRGVAAALALVALTNVIALAGVAWNRHAPPEATLDLTERELPIGYVEKEDSGLALRLDWREEFAGADPAELDREKLVALGFDCRLAPDDPAAELFYSKALPLQRYAVLEFEGDSWARRLARAERAIEQARLKVEARQEGEPAIEERRKELEQERRSGSRLSVIDAGVDAAALRRLYPDRARYAIVPALVRLWLRQTWDDAARKPGRPVLTGGVSELLAQEVHVARRFRPALAAATRGKTDPDHPPRYRVRLRFGRRLEPWIASVERITDGPAPP